MEEFGSLGGQSGDSLKISPEGPIPFRRPVVKFALTSALLALALTGIPAAQAREQQGNRIRPCGQRTGVNTGVGEQTTTRLAPRVSAT